MTLDMTYYGVCDCLEFNVMLLFAILTFVFSKSASNANQVCLF